MTSIVVNVLLCDICYSGGGYPVETRYGAGEGPIHLDDVQCSGEESSLLDCEHDGIGESNCDHDEDISIVCHSKF